MNENEKIHSTNGTKALKFYILLKQQSIITTTKMKKRPNQPTAVRLFAFFSGCIFLVISYRTLDRFQKRIASNQIEILNDISLKNFRVI